MFFRAALCHHADSRFSRIDGFRDGNAGHARAGAILPMVALLMIPCLGFLALAIDLGILAVANTQAQQAADLAALTAARSLTGTTGSNQSLATTNAANILSYNVIYGQPLVTAPMSTSGYIATSSQLTLNYGTYDYTPSTSNPSGPQFTANFSPPTSGVPLTAVTATVTGTPKAAFSTIFGFNTLGTVSATATAVHRPRDLALIMDQSASMRLGTALGFDFATSTRSTNNPDPLYPQWGAYSGSGVAAQMQGPNTNSTSATASYTVSPSNTTTPAPTGGSPSYMQTYVNSFYQNGPPTLAAPNPTLIRAFDSYSSADGGNTWTAPTSQRPQIPSGGASVTYNSSNNVSTLTYPLVAGTSGVTYPASGDYPLYVGGVSGGGYAQTVSGVVGSSARNPAWELDGYSGYSALNNTSLGTLNPTADKMVGGTTSGGSPAVTYTGATYYVNQPTYMVQITNGGSGYTSPPTVTVSGGPIATSPAPTATALISSGKVSGVTFAGVLTYNGTGSYSTSTAPTRPPLTYSHSAATPMGPASTARPFSPGPLTHAARCIPPRRRPAASRPGGPAQASLQQATRLSSSCS
jgi:Flp pilus assembly protein TadG